MVPGFLGESSLCLKNPTFHSKSLPWFLLRILYLRHPLYSFIFYSISHGSGFFRRIVTLPKEPNFSLEKSPMILLRIFILRDPLFIYYYVDLLCDNRGFLPRYYICLIFIYRLILMHSGSRLFTSCTCYSAYSLNGDLTFRCLYSYLAFRSVPLLELSIFYYLRSLLCYYVDFYYAYFIIFIYRFIRTHLFV